ncbi:hypothetical protein ISF_07568 [Cordyceps fumosorosea ARSEF 2679]|uniref:Ricin B lectin domain-containing protein n=1 Tax=Cordyceps fumosorosea (strain ARSEF 2679) TaxID=1081104 RepID=A0A167PBS0_CORFA|nr:hypothetical protein ISF_07568 [Cordyceps fumosorosea ARSEF 2679]OAA56500.1 hypothetical protein ISF_07568 [Cordyceps fumosorosea ARSEF 2679]
MFFSIGGKSSKMKPATAINSNVWYHVTEGRVDRAGRKFSSMLQVDSSTNSLKVWPVSEPPHYWQFQAVGDSDQARYVVRNSRDGAAKQLSACRNETEPADGQTGLCMAAANGADDAQVWRLDQWGADMVKDGLRFVNVANGTRFWLDVHKGNPPFMNGSVVTGSDDGKEADDEDDAKGEPSQHWYLTSAQAVNAIEYSTIPTLSSTGTQTTATAGTTSDSEPTASAGAEATDATTKTELSPGAQAGIGIAVALGVIALGVAALLLWRRRRRTQQQQQQQQQQLDPTPFTAAAIPPGTPNTNKPLPPIGAAAAAEDEKKVYELPDADHNGSYYKLPQELPTPTGPLSPRLAREIEAQRYELDSTPVSR